MALICCAYCAHMHSSLRIDCPQCRMKARAQEHGQSTAKGAAFTTHGFATLTKTTKSNANLY